MEYGQGDLKGKLKYRLYVTSCLTTYFCLYLRYFSLNSEIDVSDVLQ